MAFESLAPEKFDVLRTMCKKVQFWIALELARPLIKAPNLRLELELTSVVVAGAGEIVRSLVQVSHRKVLPVAHTYSSSMIDVLGSVRPLPVEG